MVKYYPIGIATPVGVYTLTPVAPYMLQDSACTLSFQ